VVKAVTFGQVTCVRALVIRPLDARSYSIAVVFSMILPAIDNRRLMALGDHWCVRVVFKSAYCRTRQRLPEATPLVGTSARCATLWQTGNGQTRVQLRPLVPEAATGQSLPSKTYS
jgi:hypothetical protein